MLMKRNCSSQGDYFKVITEIFTTQNWTPIMLRRSLWTKCFVLKVDKATCCTHRAFLPMDCYLDAVGGLVPLRCEEGRPKAKKWQQQNYWTEAVQLTNTDDRPDLSSEGAPDFDKIVNVKHKLKSDHETQMGVETKTYWPTDRRS
jgi:hypothetical protein